MIVTYQIPCLPQKPDILPFEEFGLHAPPGVEMHVFDATDVVDVIDHYAAAD